MNTLPTEKRTLILSLLAEGNSLRTISRVSGVARNTISKLLLEAGEKAKEILDREMVNLQVKHLQVDEIWTFVQKKQKLVTPEDTVLVGDQYVFVALDPDTKLVPSFSVGKRTLQMATSFMRDLRTRIRTRFQLSTDSLAAYRDAVDFIFGQDIDYAMVHKNYRAIEGNRNEVRYSPGHIVGVIKKRMAGEPDPKHISTSLVERQNLTMRMQMRRFTRLTNGFSKSLRHLEAALALHFFHYNFMRIHETLRVTPAMQAGISRHLMTWEEFWGWNSEEKRAA